MSQSLRSALAGALALLIAAAPARADQSPHGVPTSGTLPGLNLVNDLNAAINSIDTCNSGASSPTNAVGGAPVAGQCWLNTATATAEALSIYDGGAWLQIAIFDSIAHVWKPAIGGGVGTIASATTIDIGAKPETWLQVTGATTIASLGSSAPLGSVKFLTFAGALTLTYNASTLLLPGAANITTAAGDDALAIAIGAGAWQILYFPATGAPLVHSLIGVQTFTVGGTFTADSGTRSCIVEVQAAGGGSGGAAATSTNQFAMGASGSAGSYAKAYFAACAPNGDAVTIGAVGAAGITGGGAGGAASAAIVGGHVSCPGGVGGGGGVAAGSGTGLAVAGAAQPAACTITGASTIPSSARGGPGQYGFTFANNSAESGYGGNSQSGQGPAGVPCNQPGVAGNSYGTGASGALACASFGGAAGAAGGPAIVSIYEFN